MRKCGAVLSSGYYNPPSSPVLDLANTGVRKADLLERERDRKKVFIQLSPEELNVAFGDEIVSKKGRRCSDYTPRSKGQLGNQHSLTDVWKYPRKEGSGALVASSSHSRPASELSKGRASSRNEMDRPGEVSVHVGSPSRGGRDQRRAPGGPVSIRLSPSPQRSPVRSPQQRSPVNSRPSSARRVDSEPGMQVDLTEGVQIRVSSPRKSSATSLSRTGGGGGGGGNGGGITATASGGALISSQHFHLENNPAQSVTVRTMKDVNVRTQALKDGVQFRLDGRPGVQLSVKMGEPTNNGTGLRNSIKIEAQTPMDDDGFGGGMYGRGGKGGRWDELLSYQRPTVSHLIHARMTQLYKELRKSIPK
ncbi:uncharacterized protein LOC9654611 isoform X1 [Selaginella moellendorffii]|uniref:uncharacterized protein LOC9654611 isoform X1 n=1 Tax=Selaginella moellendorffii TaxID=88036 RepID=UPI000D1CD253|nr:uncharacterized protein LOC9654611 isoform X1 [Selaginella moellendorffii]|eukprot:XP_024544032.1 uncharacterized protein LOC9654611 isoform X1 [Selaginella moellendorffii]